MVPDLTGLLCHIRHLHKTPSPKEGLCQCKDQFESASHTEAHGGLEGGGGGDGGGGSKGNVQSAEPLNGLGLTYQSNPTGAKGQAEF